MEGGVLTQMIANDDRVVLLMRWNITLVNTIFGAKNQNMFFSYFDGADSENDLSFSWLANVFVIL